MIKFLLSKTNLDTPKFSLKGKKCYCKVVKVYDGDTITVNLLLHNKFSQFNIRMFGYDSPELRTKNLVEKEKGFEAQFFLEELLKNKIVFIVCDDFDKYGRLLGNVYVSKKDYKLGKSVNDLMISSGHGVPYFGGTK